MSIFRNKRFLGILHTLLRMTLGAIFVYASWHKIVQPSAFAQSIANYQILPALLVNPTALFLPWLELICGIALLIGRMIRGSALIIGILLVIFISALTYAQIIGLDIQCGCFSSGGRNAGNIYFDILLDTVLLILAVWLVIRPGGAKRLNISPYVQEKAVSSNGPDSNHQ